MKFWEVAAFTGKKAAGNPAGVCLLTQEVSEKWMQECASRLAYPETAYLMPCGGVWLLRWFTPVCEVDLCGHATLASAHLLWSEGISSGQSLCFDTRGGPLSARQTLEGIELDFPAIRPQLKALPPGLLGALGLKSCAEGFFGGGDYCVVLEDSQSVVSLKPDLKKLLRFAMRGVCVTALAAPEDNVDFVSRFFAPRAGIPEDSATGSVHCLLGPYWETRLRRSYLRAFQASPRGGSLGVRVEGERVKLIGHAQITAIRDLSHEAF